ncbi:MAG: hypothetical protein WDN28_27170 [Chthoniobacter sp.]
MADENYHKFRPRLAVAKKDAVPLDDTFGLHPNLRELEAAWQEGDLAIIHGAGGESDTRSHFEAQDLMEHGARGGGRVARPLSAGTRTIGEPAGGRRVVADLAGEPLGRASAAAFESLREFAITDVRQGARKEDFTRELQRLYALEKDALRAAANNTFEALRRIEAIDAQASPEHGAVYEEKYPFAQGLRQIAQLIKADVGLDVASIDLGGWDSHFTQQTLIDPLMRQLATASTASVATWARAWLRPPWW